MIRPRALTLDVTGTLIHSPRRYRLYSEILRRHGIEISEARLGELFPLVWKELDCQVAYGEDRYSAHPRGPRGFWFRLLERLCELAGQSRPSPFLASELYGRFIQEDAWEVYPEARATLRALHDLEIPMAVIGNWDERLPRVLSGLGLAPYLRTVVYAQEVGVEKPHPAIFEEALRRLGAEPPLTLHVGDDRRRDLEGALALGMQARHLDRDGSGSGKEYRASESPSIRDLSALLPLFTR